MKPRRAVFDTNVFISAFLFGGNPARAIGYALDGAVQCFISAAILEEIRDVLQRKKFGLTAEQVLKFAEEIHALCQLIEPSEPVHEILEDPDDNRVLECALAADADMIVSGDAHLLALKKWRGIQIIDPARFAALMGSGQ